MKKRNIIAITLAVLILLSFTLVSCGNMSMGFGNFNYEKVHIMNYDGTGKCVSIDKWYDNETGIEVKTSNYGSLYLSEGTYILVGDECPYCN